MPVKKEERKLLSEADVASIDESKASSAPPVISKRSRENSSTKCKVCTARLAKKGKKKGAVSEARINIHT